MIESRVIAKHTYKLIHLIPFFALFFAWLKINNGNFFFSFLCCYFLHRIQWIPEHGGGRGRWVRNSRFFRFSISNCFATGIFFCFRRKCLIKFHLILSIVWSNPCHSTWFYILCFLLLFLLSQFIKHSIKCEAFLHTNGTVLWWLLPLGNRLRIDFPLCWELLRFVCLPLGELLIWNNICNVWLRL